MWNNPDEFQRMLGNRDWTSVTSGFGDSTTLFAAANAIASDGAAYQQDDLATLRLGVCPEPGALFDATPIFVPILIHLIPRLRAEDLADTLTTLGRVAAAEFEAADDLDDDENSAEKARVSNSHQAVAAGLDRFIEQLQHPAAEVKIATCYLLAKIGRLETESPEHIPQKLRQAIRETFAREQETIVRVGVVYAFADLNLWPDVESIITREDLAAEVMIAGTLTLLENDLRHDVAPLLRETFSKFAESDDALDEIEEMFAELPWNDQSLEYLVHVQLDRVGAN